MYFHFFHHSKYEKGFGLIELMVSISIMLLVAGIILVRQSGFNGAVLLQGQAYEIALATREVQTNAVSASAIQGTTREMLGVYFDTSRNTTYRIFRDDERNGSYESSEEYGQQNSLDSRFEIRAIRLDGVEQSAVSVMFERPNFDAKFYVNSTQVAASRVKIDLGAKDGSTEEKSIVITATGHISVL
jgi:prepilin-type N-terminal cleavage/methylation domain-containing protein